MLEVIQTERSYRANTPNFGLYDKTRFNNRNFLFNPFKYFFLIMRNFFYRKLKDSKKLLEI